MVFEKLFIKLTDGNSRSTITANISRIDYYISSGNNSIVVIGGKYCEVKEDTITIERLIQAALLHYKND